MNEKPASEGRSVDRDLTALVELLNHLDSAAGDKIYPIEIVQKLTAEGASMNDPELVDRLDLALEADAQMAFNAYTKNPKDKGNRLVMGPEGYHFNYTLDERIRGKMEAVYQRSIRSVYEPARRLLSLVGGSIRHGLEDRLHAAYGALVSSHKNLDLSTFNKSVQLLRSIHADIRRNTRYAAMPREERVKLQDPSAFAAELRDLNAEQMRRYLSTQRISGALVCTFHLDTPQSELGSRIEQFIGPECAPAGVRIATGDLPFYSLTCDGTPYRWTGKGWFNGPSHLSIYSGTTVSVKTELPLKEKLSTNA